MTGPAEGGDEDGELAEARRDNATLRALVRDLQTRLAAIGAVCAAAPAS